VDDLVSGLARLRAMPPPDRVAVLTRCCASRRWVDAMAAGVDECDDDSAVLELAERVWWELSAHDWREALDAHPKIGERTAEGSQEGREQGAMADAGPALRGAIEEGNRAYEQRFGMTYLVRASGRSAAEMLLLLRQRLDNEPADELRIAAGEQAEITRLRLAGVLAQDVAA
jgi:OHCU decarboxylase